MIGKRVRKRREELGLTQKELADRMGYKSKSTINKIELDINDVNQTTLSRLAEALDIDVLYFFDDTESFDTIAKYILKIENLTEEKRRDVFRYIDYIESIDKGGTHEENQENL